MWKKLICVGLICLGSQTGFAQFDFSQLFKSMAGNMGIPFDGENFAQNLQQQLAPLQNLGATIQNQVQQSLMPVYAMTIKNQMANGVGGVTVAIYLGNNPKVFIIKDGVRRVCHGQVEGSRCLGSLELFQIVNSEDLCFTKTYSQINDYICLSAGQISVRAVNNDVACDSTNGLPTLLLTQMQYKNLCGNQLPWEVHYRYYPNLNDPRAIPVPHSNPYVRCLTNEPGVCEFEGDQTTGGGGATYFSTGHGAPYFYKKR